MGAKFYIPIIELNYRVCLVWPCKYGLVRMVLLFFMAMCSLILLSMALCVLLWSCMVFYGLVTHFMVFNGRISSFLAVIDPNSFGLVVPKVDERKY